MTVLFRVTRDVPADEPGNWLGTAAKAGEVFELFEGCTYGSCDEENGIALTDQNGEFFEFPRNAVERVDK